MADDKGNPHLDGFKVGLIIPSLNTTTEPEFAWIAPPRISFHAARVFMDVTTAEALRTMNAEVHRASELLATLSPDVVAYACTSGSFVDGPTGTKQLVEGIASIVKCPVVATSVAMIAALQHLGVRRCALATPYPRDITEQERQFLVKNGLEVVSTVCLEKSGAAIRQTPRDQVEALIRSADRPSAEAIFASCTDLRALEVVDRLERELGKPILTSNQVTLWAVLKSLNVGTSIRGFGRLLSGGSRGEILDVAL